MTPSTTDMMEIFRPEQSSPLEAMAPNVSAALGRKGTALLRGYTPDLTEFESFSRLFCDRFHRAGTRYKDEATQGDGFSTRTFAKNIVLLAHAEGLYAPLASGRPDLAFFLCAVPPAAGGGETTVTDGKTFLERMPADMRKRFEGGIVYRKIFDKERWQYEFDVETVEELRDYLNTFPNVRFQITHPQEHLMLLNHTPAFTLSRQGLPVFATGMLAHLPRVTHPRYREHVPTNAGNGIFFADGQPIPDDIINGLIDIQSAIQYPHAWQKGDILVLDNTRFLHGRNLTDGPCERVLFSRFGWVKP